MAYEYERYRELSVLVQSLKRSVEDLTPREVGRISEEWRRAVIALEEVRVILRQAGRGAARPVDLDLVAEAREKLIQIASSGIIMSVIGRIPLRPLPPTGQYRILEDFRGQPSEAALHAAIDLAEVLLKEAELELELPRIIDAERLRRIVPQQKIAPAKFGIDHDKIIILPQRHTVPKDDKSAAEAARAHLQKSGAKIVAALSASNCDRRLIEAVEDLQTALAEPGNIIELGLNNLSCEAICGAAKDELPDAICGMLKAHTAAIGMFVAQFPEWQKFAENAAAVELTASDVEEINRAANQIIAQMESNPEVADEAVPKTIRAIRDLTSDPAKTAKKAAFALLRTVENFVSTALSYGADFIGQTARKTSDELSTAISKTAAGVLLAAAIAGASQMTGVTDRIAEAGWIKNALEIVRQQGSAD